MIFYRLATAAQRAEVVEWYPTLDEATSALADDENPAKLAGRNPQPKAKEITPFTIEEIDRIGLELSDDDGPGYGPLVVFAAETALMPEEWIALERRDVLRDTNVVIVERACVDGQVKPYGKTARRRRRVPLSTRALEALKQVPPRLDTRLLFPAAKGGYIHLDNWRNREWYPALEAAGLAKRGPYALRHTAITHMLAAPIPILDVARYAGTSVQMIERHYGHLAKGSEGHARQRLDAYHERLGQERVAAEEEGRS